ncbi:uncharacterized protein LOC112430973 [Maylandia zebra]|uniref:uncharacterized protein C15orf39 homolog n=1 Tax=Maylandia zebra TaxID=106582 RepID=UPI000D300224|nr:uncharacterized protein C15orf39 homolog [Maylandia zebra]
MLPDRLPFIGSSGTKSTAKPTPSSPGLWHPHQSSRRKRNRQQKTSFSSDTHPHPGPSSILLSDATMTPWGRLALSESCFDSIPKILTPRPSPPPPPASPVPEQIPSATPYHGRRQEEDKDSSGSSFNSQIPSPPVAVTQNSAGGAAKDLQLRRRVLPQCRLPRAPRLPPLHPVTDLSFSRSFTFSFFELPLHQSPRWRAERVKNLLLLLKQIHY